MCRHAQFRGVARGGQGGAFAPPSLFFAPPSKLNSYDFKLRKALYTIASHSYVTMYVATNL